MVLLTEIHDRIHGKRITLAKGIDEPVTIPDPQTGQPLMTGEQVPTGAWLVQGGFPYHGIRYDMTRPLLAPGQ
jgi:hypothetical protein